MSDVIKRELSEGRRRTKPNAEGNLLSASG
jgi:hypothetical protein